MSEQKTALIISAHAADFVWRCGGAIALHAKLGYEVSVVCLSYGERGESARLWKEGKSLDQVKSIRRKEAENAAHALNVHDIKFLDLGDYPLNLGQEAQDQVVDIIRAVQPKFMMSHSQYDPYNTDHMRTTDFALTCRMIAQAWGHNPGKRCWVRRSFICLNHIKRNRWGGNQIRFWTSPRCGIKNVQPWNVMRGKFICGIITPASPSNVPIILNAILAGRQGDVIANMQKGSNPSFRELLMNYRGGHEHIDKPIF